MFYILTFVPNANHTELSTTDGFNQVIGISTNKDKLVNVLLGQLEADEKLSYFEIMKMCEYYYTNYGTYKLEKIVITP